MTSASEHDADIQPGSLYVVATPIGNLGDLSPRARAVLAGVSRIAAEDTRTTAVLLRHCGVDTPMTALHDHNEAQVVDGLVARLQAGESLALVSDAGTPLISDPGFQLVRAARNAGCAVLAVPGPCAAIAALSIAGLPSDSFLFVGFLPPKPAARRQRIAELAHEPRTVLLYESSHRVVDSLADLAAVLGERPLMLGRELSKRFEQSVLLPATALTQWIAEDPNRQRGEFVLAISPAPAADSDQAREAQRLLRVLLAEMPASRAARAVAALTGLRKQVVYELALGLGDADANDADATEGA